MPIVAAFVLLAFWFRDYMSLRMSPSRKATRRALVYGAAILFTAVLLWTLAVTIGVGDFARRIESPPILLLLVAFHVGASVLSFWVKRTQSYEWMWATALLPAPIVWLLLLETTLLSDQGLGVVAPQFSFFAVAVLWATSMIVVIFRTRHSEMPLEDLDFAVLFGGLSHWLAMCALPLALLVTP
jgi:hypothetical protein